jgi:hypothetical protein
MTTSEPVESTECLASAVDLLHATIWKNINPDLWSQKNHTGTRSYVANDFQNSFANRVIGFLAELAYPHVPSVQHMRNSLYPGGWLIPSYGWEQDPLRSKCYFTVGRSEFLQNNGMTKVYSSLKKALRNMRMFYLCPRDNIDWSNLSRDSYRYFLFDAGKAAFAETSADCFFQNWTKKPARTSAMPSMHAPANQNLLAYTASLLCGLGVGVEDLRLKLLERHLFDVEIAGGYWKGRPTDIDYIELHTDGSIRLIDVKDKYLSQAETLGLNDDHVSFFPEMDKRLGTKTLYVVRVCENSDARPLVGWYQIELARFATARQGTGNAGANGAKARNTREIPFHDFTRL